MKIVQTIFPKDKRLMENLTQVDYFSNVTNVALTIIQETSTNLNMEEVDSFCTQSIRTSLIEPFNLVKGGI